MSSDPEVLTIERNTIFVLTALLLMAIVSISFYNLDRHPAFPAASDQAVDAIDATGSPVILADDPVSLAALEARQSELRAAVRPVSSWPAQAPLFTFGPVPAIYTDYFETTYDESVWTLWHPLDMEPLPVFDTASVELIDAQGDSQMCPRDADGAHQCGDASWTRIQRRTLTIGGERERCIWAHPIQDKTLRIRFSDVPAVDATGKRLRLETGLSDSAVGTGVPVDFRVRVDTRSVSHRHADRRGWQSVLLPTLTEPSDLVIDVSSSDVGRRHICFRFDLR